MTYDTSSTGGRLVFFFMLPFPAALCLTAPRLFAQTGRTARQPLSFLQFARALGPPNQRGSRVAKAVGLPVTSVCGRVWARSNGMLASLTP